MLLIVIASFVALNGQVGGTLPSVQNCYNDVSNASCSRHNNCNTLYAFLHVKIVTPCCQICNHMFLSRDCCSVFIARA